MSICNIMLRRGKELSLVDGGNDDLQGSLHSVYCCICIVFLSRACYLISVSQKHLLLAEVISTNIHVKKIAIVGEYRDVCWMEKCNSSRQTWVGTW
jgi:hypothetical protein